MSWGTLHVSRGYFLPEMNVEVKEMGQEWRRSASGSLVVDENSHTIEFRTIATKFSACYLRTQKMFLMFSLR